MQAFPCLMLSYNLFFVILGSTYKLRRYERTEGKVLSFCPSFVQLSNCKRFARREERRHDTWSSFFLVWVEKYLATFMRQHLTKSYKEKKQQKTHTCKKKNPNAKQETSMTLRKCGKQLDKRDMLNYNYISWQENHHEKIAVLFSTSFSLSVDLGQIMLCDLPCVCVCVWMTNFRNILHTTQFNVLLNKCEYKSTCFP